jgi:hypothetical protein
MERGSVIKAALYMGVILLLLIWLPIVGPVVAGIVGGRAARTVGKALVASVIPSVVLGIALFAILNAFDLPLIGALSGIALFLFVLVGDVPMAIGGRCRGGGDAGLANSSVTTSAALGRHANPLPWAVGAPLC